MKRTHFKRIMLALGIATALMTSSAFANQYPLPQFNNATIGELGYVSGTGETLLSIGQRYNIGVNAMANANPGITDTGPLASGIYVQIPGKHVLPPLPRRGIIINLAEMRMYYFPEGTDKVMTFPIGIGRVGKTVPVGETAISRKTVNPTWTPPADIREFDRLQGIELPKAMGPGPDNPLGPFALYLRVPTYLIHSTIFPESIGRRASFGCIRMNEGDIKQFYPLVRPGTHVSIVNMPNKVGWDGNVLFLETHPALEEHDDGGTEGVVGTVQKSLAHQGVTFVNWQMVSYLANQRDGVPHDIGFRVE